MLRADFTTPSAKPSTSFQPPPLHTPPSCPITILLTRLCVPIPTRRGSAAPSARHPRNPSREPVPRDATVPLPATHTNKQRRTSMIGYSCTVQLYGTRTDGTYCEYNTYRLVWLYWVSTSTCTVLLVDLLVVRYSNSARIQPYSCDPTVLVPVP
jgi:hypothetical protein